MTAMWVSGSEGPVPSGDASTSRNLRSHDHFEPGIRLVRRYVEALGGRAFRGCEGHAAGGDSVLQPRHLGVVARDEREHPGFYLLLRSIAAQANSAAGSRVQVEIGEFALRADPALPRAAIDIVFAPQPGLAGRDYFEHLAMTYFVFGEHLEATAGHRHAAAVSDAQLLSAARRFYDNALSWHCKEAQTSAGSDDIAAMALHLHAMNFGLWHHEDAVRRAGADDHEVARRKRRIDELNAGRNAAIEDIDAAMLDRVGPNPSAPLHTDTPGTIVDRLSVLALRILHTNRAQDPGARLAVLEEQYDDLFGGLERFLTALRDGSIRFKLYRQFKSAHQRDYCALFETRDS